MTAHQIPRIGLARARGEHLRAANDIEWDGQPRLNDWITLNEGRSCPACLRATRRAAMHAALWMLGAGALLAVWTFFYGWITA